MCKITNKNNILMIVYMSNYSHFNIANLFSNKKNGTVPNFTGSIDINTLFQHTNDETQNNNIDSKVLLDGIYEKRDKLNKYYNKIFKKCWDTIKSANKSGFTDIDYEIPKFSEYIGYNCKDCISFIKAKCDEQKLDVVKINSRVINISWKDLEKKINNVNNNVNNNANSVERIITDHNDNNKKNISTNNNTNFIDINKFMKR
jgi:hypothetical protein